MKYKGHLFWYPAVIFIFVLAFELKAQTMIESNDVRFKQSINDNWRFSLRADEGFTSISFNDSGWNSINLPHTWNKEDAFDENKEYYRGTGFYRKNIYLNPEWVNKKIFLYFEGANQVTDVYLNQEYVGQHIGGYTAFAFDITSLLSFENENMLAVKVDNQHNKNIPPLNADFTFYGGIYRDVWLIITDAVHIDVLNYASPGIFIDTPELSNERAMLRIRGTILNESDETSEVKVVSRVLDKGDSEVAVESSTFYIDGNSQQTLRHTTSIMNPQLWSPDSPYLYKIISEIYKDDILVDKLSNTFGLRWFSFDSDSGFYLNNKQLKLLGTNRHQDFENYGNALPNHLHQSDVKIIKENGFNFLRLAHYPQDPVVLETADELGLIVWEEIPIVNMITVSDSFNSNCRTMLIEMIRQNYNHPSIIMWGYMNEVMLREPEKIPEGYYKAIVSLAKKLEGIVKTEDNSRATVMAVSYGEIENDTGIDEISDIIGMNLYFGWYYETLETFGDFLDGYHNRNPYRPIIISEYGAGSDERIHSFNPEAFDFSIEYQQIFHEKTFKQIIERDFILGSAVWNQFDFGSNHRHDTKPLINQKGLYYLNRKPKDISYYYKAKLSKEPVIHIAVDDWKNRGGYGNELTGQPLKIYTNLDSVSVFKDDKHIGDYIPENCTVNLKLNPGEGKNLIKVSGDFEGEKIEEISKVFYIDMNSIFDETDKKIFAINLGADFEFIDDSGTIWLPGNISKNKKWEIGGGNPIKTHHKIINTKDEPLYQTSLEGIESCRFDIPDGSYEVQFYFSENKFDKGERVFNIYINNILTFDNLDLAGDFRKYKAVIKKVNIRTENNSGIEIEFVPVKNKSLLSGIKLEKLNK